MRSPQLQLRYESGRRYSIQKSQNSSYFIHNYSVDGTYSFPKGIIFSTDAYYTVYSGNPSVLNKNYFVWNASLAKQLFKNNQAQLKLSINDILNRNINVIRNAADNFIEDVSYKTLRRYFMVTFLYNINKVGIRNFKTTK